MFLSKIACRTVARGSVASPVRRCFSVLLPASTTSRKASDAAVAVPYSSVPRQTTMAGREQIRWFSNSDFEQAVLKRHAKRKTKSMIAAWDAYLDGKSDAHTLLQVIDLSHDLKVSALELSLFIDAVAKKGVSPAGLKLLQQLVDENKENHHYHELDEQEWMQWLNIATTHPDATPPPSATPSSSAAAGVLRLRAKRKCKIMNFAWDQYLQHDGNLGNVFKVIDLNRNHKISALELQVFLESVEQKKMSPEAMTALDVLDDHYEMDFQEFADFMEKYSSA